MSQYQTIQYISYSGLFLALLFSVYFLGPEFVPNNEKYEIFEGYLIDDEEFQGFLRCSGEAGVSFTDPYGIGVSDSYWIYRTNIREPIYFKVLGRITEDGGPGWGMAGEPWDQNIEIVEIIDVRKGDIANCRAHSIPVKIIVNEVKPKPSPPTSAIPPPSKGS